MGQTTNRAERIAADHFERLVRSVSHDLNNLLTILSGNLGLLTGPEEPVASRWEVIGDCRDALEQAHNTTLTFRSVLYGADESPPPCADGFDAVQQTLRVVELCQRGFPSGLVIQARTSAQRAVALGDALGFRVALFNLLQNARDAGSRRVEVSVADAGGGWVVEVRDDGQGIDPAHMDRVMDPFFTTRSERGRPGLGLHQARLFVRECGGRIEFESDPGNGTTVCLWLNPPESSPVE